MIIAAFLSMLGSFTLGPSKILHFPDSLILIMLSQALHGAIDPHLMVPALPEMIESVQSKYPEHLQNKLNDICSGLFNMFLGIGLILGPIYSSVATKHYGFKECGDSIAFVSFGFGLIYYTVTKFKN